jgi:hypothetical protein
MIEEGDYIAHFCILASGSIGAYIDRWCARILGGGTSQRNDIYHNNLFIVNAGRRGISCW